MFLVWWKHCLNSCSCFASSLQIFLHCVKQTSFLPQPPNLTSGILLPEPICHELHGVLPGGRKSFCFYEWLKCRVSWSLGRDFNMICWHVAFPSLHGLAFKRNFTWEFSATTPRSSWILRGKNITKHNSIPLESLTFPPDWLVGWLVGCLPFLTPETQATATSRHRYTSC